MHSRKFSLSFFLLSILAGVAGFLLGEYLLATLKDTVPKPVLIGLYFGQLGLFIGFFCLLAEYISPVINGKGWRLEYSGTSWKILVPAAAGIMLVGGIAFQFLYQLNMPNIKPPNDIVLVLDTSQSMKDTDPNQDSLKAAKQLINTMENKYRAAVITFNHEARVTQPMFSINDKKKKAEALKRITALTPSGQTNIGLALDKAMEQMTVKKEKNRNPVVILFSDGYSKFNLAESLNDYQKKKIAVNTIGMSKIDAEGAHLLKQIAAKTGGTFYDITETSQLSNVFKTIYLNDANRNLVEPRSGFAKTSVYLSIIRVLFITLLGALIGLVLGIIFDNRYLAKSYIIGGILAGLMAGLILELGSGNAFDRVIADIILAVVTGLGTMLIPVKEKYSSLSSLATNSKKSPKSIRNDTHVRKGF